MEAITIQKHLHTSPRKLRLVADLVRKMTPAEAVQTLRFTNKMAAKPLAQAIKVALANARTLGLIEAEIYFKSLEVNEGLKMKRMRASAKGFASGYKKRMSHIKIVLTDEKSKALDLKTEAVLTKPTKTQETKNEKPKTKKTKLAEGGKTG